MRHQPPWADTREEAASVITEQQRHEDALEDARNDARDDQPIRRDLEPGPLADALAESRRRVAGIGRA